MTKHLTKGLLALILLAVPALSQKESPKIDEKELLKRIEEMQTAIPKGDKAPFEKYYANDAVYFDEKNRSLTKEELLKELDPLPAGYIGSTKAENPKTWINKDTAIIGYEVDESLSIFGQQLKARYHMLDTWMRRDGKWQIVATQAHRYYQDPAPGKVNPSTLRDYVGKYELSPGTIMTISVENDQLYAERGGRPKAMLIAEAADIFFRKGVEGRRLFHRDDGGKVDSIIDRRNNEDIIWKRIE